jgi:hypothetical protein
MKISSWLTIKKPSFTLGRREGRSVRQPGSTTTKAAARSVLRIPAKKIGRLQTRNSARVKTGLR